MVEGTLFKENYSLGRGSVYFARYTGAIAEFRNCTFENNYAFEGGVAYLSDDSETTFYNSTLYKNFAIAGGLAFIKNNGKL